MKAPFASAAHVVRIEQARCLEMAGECRRLGSVGAFGCALIEAAVERAEQALAGSDRTALEASLDHLRSMTGNLRRDGAEPAPASGRSAAGG